MGKLPDQRTAIKAVHTYFRRNTSQAEIDYIEEQDGKIAAYEFKWNPDVKVRFPKAFLTGYQPAECRVIHRDNYWEWLGGMNIP